jgi:CheY-like chemotaxis protein
MSDILVVDDNPLNAKLAQIILTRAGHSVRLAASAAEAMAAVSHSIPEVVVTDINMPSTSGSELCRVLRVRFPHGAMHIVAYTALAMASELDAIRSVGFDDIVVKPATKDTLLAAVRGTARHP